MTSRSEEIAVTQQLSDLADTIRSKYQALKQNESNFQIHMLSFIPYIFLPYPHLVLINHDGKYVMCFLVVSLCSAS